MLERPACDETACWSPGYDTSTSAITWTLALIAAHPEVQQQVTAELAALGLLATPEQPLPKQLTWQALNDLDYLRKVIKVLQAMMLLPCTAANACCSYGTTYKAIQVSTTSHVPLPGAKACGQVYGVRLQQALHGNFWQTERIQPDPDMTLS